MSFLGVNLGSARTTANVGVEPFPDPFCDYASLAMPNSWLDALKFCEYVVLNQGVYRAAIERILAYFITEVEIDGTDRKGKEKYKDYLYDTMGVHTLLRAGGLDYITYGNIVMSCDTPIRRSLSCPKCGFDLPMHRVTDNPKFSFRWTGFKFMADCPMCHYSGAWTHNDRRMPQQDGINVKRWNIKEIDLQWDPWSHDVGYIWRIPAYYKDHIVAGRPFQLQRAPWEVVEAIKNGTHLLLNEDEIFHAKEDTLSGVLNRGWGISRVLTNFRQSWYLQVIHRLNEAVGLDYVFPFRLLTPAPRSSGGQNGMMGDPVLTTDLGGFRGQLEGMLRQRRRDPTSWFVLPFPVQYQMLGAEGNQLAPYQLLDQAADSLLTAIGMPVDFYKGSMTIQAAPVGIRLLESQWSPLVRVLNRMLQWLVDKVSAKLGWDSVRARLERPSMVDDLNRQLAKIQMMTAQQISQTTGLKSIGLKFEEEQDRMLDEQKYIAQRSDEAQEELEAMGLGEQMAQGAMAAPPGAEQAGAMPPGAMPPGAMPPTDAQGMVMPVDPVQAVLADLPRPGIDPIDPTELAQLANTKANQIFQMQGTQRNSALRQLKQRNPLVHSLVKSQLEQMDQRAASQGKAMMQQAAQAQGQQQIMPR
jgi:hypothetical protein